VNEKEKREKKENLKQERIGEIIAATRLLNETCPFLEITLADIARSARFTRSNLYKYFSCREDLFLYILTEELSSWQIDLNNTFRERHFNIKEFSHIWVDLLIKRKSMIELYSLVFSQLEKKATSSALESWNESYGLIMEKTVEILINIFPDAEKEDMKEFFYTQLAQTVGLTPLLFLNEEQVRARENHNLTSHSSYFREILSHAVESLLSPWV
jgi:AcrR family transcriptional regulator